MKRVSSLVLGAGLLLPAALVLAADAPEKAGQKAPAPAAAAPVPLGAPAPAPAAALELEPDGVTFGMGAEDVARLYDRYWDKQFVPRYQKANPGPKTQELDFELAEQKKVLRRVAIFDGRTTSFDKAEFSEEFAHGSGETMTSSKLLRRAAGSVTSGSVTSGNAKDGKAVAYSRRFFFFEDKLWKIYDEYRLEPSGPLGADYGEATRRVEGALGKAAKRTRSPESRFESVTFDTGASRVRVVRLPSSRVAVVRSDSALAQQVLERRAQHARLVESESDLDEDIQAVIR